MVMKVSKKTNLELMESLLSKIESYGYHIKDKKFGNCYFLFEGDDNSICHFHIKEIPGFLFGLWNTCRFDTIKYQIKHNGIGHTWADSLDISPLSEIVFFTQYERDLDKFKPSRSGFVTGLYREVWEEGPDSEHIKIVEDWRDFELQKILEFMKKHPIRSAEYAGAELKYIWEDSRSGFNIFFQWVKDWYYHWKYELKYWISCKVHKLVTKHFVRSLKSFQYIVEDRGSSWTPRLSIYMRRNKEINTKQYNKDWIKLEKFDDRWFNRISLNVYEVDIMCDDITSDDLKEDDSLNVRFQDIIKSIIELQDDKNYVGNIIYTNVKELMK